MSGFLFETKEEGIMEQLSRVQLYRSLSQKGISENFSDVLQINMVILDGVENLFLTSDEGVESGYIDIYQVIQITRENLERLWNENYSVDRKQIEKLQERIRKVLLSFESKENSNKTARNLFNKILNELGDVTPGSIYAYIDRSLGGWEQRPVFKANIKRFVSLRSLFRQ